MPRAGKAASQPARSTGGDHNVSEQKVGQDSPRALKSTGPASEALEQPLVQAVERPLTQSKAEALAFNEEILTIVVLDSNDPNDDPVPCVQNDGVSQYFIRGRKQRVKRKFVEVLARARRTTWSQQKDVNAVGDEYYRNNPRTALRYPFNVIHDPNPRGREWLDGILQEG